MATIKAIEARSVHQIQSGQVIVDLCSVVKELVENSLDAGATSIDVRFKNNGLDLIEVQDNGSGIAPDNYENVALKHYTSKLSSFDDLSRLQTFGFRGEALSSLCALSEFRIVTAQAHQVPKANRLEFETSGKLKSTHVVAGQKGTTASVEGLFKRLPVRRKELEKNIKREYGKVLNLLHAYACISTGIRFSAKSTLGKNRNVVVFATNRNQTTKENIANVYGAKTLSALIPLDLTLRFDPSPVTVKRAAGGEDDESNKILVRGHISRPVFGEGRQTPDRQMFFVNSRPCSLPQIAKAFNEVYKSYNVSQSPFIFADFHMDTNAYDVNVSPDKRTILLHDAGALIESLKESLTRLFENADQTVPQSQVLASKQPGIKQHFRDGLQVRMSSTEKGSGLDADEEPEGGPSSINEEKTTMPRPRGKLASFLSGLSSHAEASSSPAPSSLSTQDVRDTSSAAPIQTSEVAESSRQIIPSSNGADPETERNEEIPAESVAEVDTLPASSSRSPPSSTPDEQRIRSLETSSPAETPNTIQNAFDRMRPRRVPAEVATITVGNRTVTSIVGSGIPRKRDVGSSGSPASGTRPPKRRIHTPSRPNIFGQHMKAFAAPGSQLAEALNSDAEEMDEIEDEDEAESSVSQSSSGVPGSPSHDVTQDRGPLNNFEGGDEIETDDTKQATAAPDANDINEEEKRAEEEARVQKLIYDAEQTAVLSQDNSMSRVNKLNKGAIHRDSTVNLISTVDGSVSRIERQLEELRDSLHSYSMGKCGSENEADGAMLAQGTAEDRLSLTVTKQDFDRMRIIGQFNLGFILATRPAESTKGQDELFIIDQHASDEKFNFERFQTETIIQNQRLVQPKTLDLTAVEEEIVLENQAALEKNGFVVQINDSGDVPIGQRCKLVSLPLSKEVVFGIRDLEELIVLLSETPSTATQSASNNAYTPRPSKVQKMFAMRACRSSIMIGKTLTHKQMEKVVRNMGTIDKPWNCPHGRPTMRHLVSLGEWREWDEWSESGDGDDDDDGDGDGLGIWRRYFREADELDESEEEQDSEDGPG
ncbi:hypothetical protein MPDQ_005748 [Monascus purpureus]|uniref:DNA mismatch repair protein PMS1 n=1 Tax=Monascus purpureus TaxID=5098 RepID=A0A507QVX1_MONPU|nr:hypothetical protein MPDQ_005748 [Monascus purpureus]